MCRRRPDLLPYLRGRVLEWLKPGYQDMRQHQQIPRALIVFIEPSQNPRRNQLAQHRPCKVHILPITQMTLLAQKLRAVDEQAINNRNVVLLI